MRPAWPLLQLSEGDVAALGLDVRAVRLAIQDAFRSYSEGRVRGAPKTSVGLGPGHAFQSLVAVDIQRAVAVLKWIAMVPPGGDATVNINATLLLSDARTGQLRCMMDGRQATALRTAGMSAVAAGYLAGRDSEAIGFIGAGVQADSHLAALAEALPSLRSLHVHSRTPATAERFAERGRALGFAARVATAEEVVRASDVVVTSVPPASGLQPFLDAAWLRPGALAIAVDLGRPWRHAALADVDVTVIDEETMRRYAKPGDLVPDLAHAHATLADLAGGRHDGRTKCDERIVYVSGGSAVADLAIAVMIHERSVVAGIGTRLAP